MKFFRCFAQFFKDLKAIQGHVIEWKKCDFHSKVSFTSCTNCFRSVSFTLACKHILARLSVACLWKSTSSTQHFQHFEFEKQINLHSKNVSENLLCKKRFQLLCEAISVPLLRSGAQKIKSTHPLL